MLKQNSAQVKAKAITQVGIIVKDLQKAVENYWNILGIGPWRIYDWDTPIVYNRKYHGKLSRAKEKIADTMVGTVQLELCQPVAGDSIYQDWLDEHGEGLHHLQFPVDDVAKAVAMLGKQGFPCLQEANHGPVECNAAYSYVDIKPLNTIWEPVHEPPDIVLPHTDYPSIPRQNSAQVKAKAITQVGIIVKDLQKAVENYWNILGIGPWRIYDWDTPIVYNRKYHGKLSRAKEKIADTMVGTVQLELCQPVAGDSIYQDWLDEHGEGLHHLQFPVDDVAKAVAMLGKQGFPCLQEANHGPVECNAAYSYVDIKPLNTIWEPVHEPPDIVLPHTDYPSEKT